MQAFFFQPYPSLHPPGSARCDDINRDVPILAKEGDGQLGYWFGAFGLIGEGGGPGNFGSLYYRVKLLQ